MTKYRITPDLQMDLTKNDERKNRRERKRQSMAIVIYAGDRQQSHVNSMQRTEEAGNRENKTIHAQDLHAFPKAGSAMDAKKGLARKQAMKLVGDAWDRDQKVSHSIADMVSEKKSKTDELLQLKSKMNDIDSMKSKYREEYQIDPDSQEQKDLELLEKYQNNKYGAFSDKFS